MSSPATPWLLPAGARAAGKALKLFEAVRRRSLVPDVFTYDALIGACGKRERPERPWSSSGRCSGKAWCLMSAYDNWRHLRCPGQCL